MKVSSVIFRLIAVAGPIAMLSAAVAAPLKPPPEDRYIAVRDAAIAKISLLYDAKSDDAAKQAEDAARSDLEQQMIAILGEPPHAGFGPARLNLETFAKGDEDFGTLDGLRFDAILGANGEKAGGNGADGKYVEPRSHLVVTTQTMFARWLRAHKDWWDKGSPNVPQQIGAALQDENFYTQAFVSGAAVVKIDSLPIAKPASTTFAYGMLGAHTQDQIPNAADEVFVAALAGGKVYAAHGSIEPKVQVPACIAIRDEYNKRAEKADEHPRRKSADNLPDFRQQGEDAYKRCFTQRAPREPAFAEATRQAQALLAAALGK
jgi:hypothetical protein